MLFCLWILKLLLWYRKTTSPTLCVCCLVSVWLLTPVDLVRGNWLYSRSYFDSHCQDPAVCYWELLGVKKGYKERRQVKMSQWALIASAVIPWDYARAKMINTGPLSKDSKSPGTTLQGNFNHLDICWVTNTAVTWTLNYVRTALLSSRWKHIGDGVTLTWLQENSKPLMEVLGCCVLGAQGEPFCSSREMRLIWQLGQCVLIILMKRKPTWFLKKKFWLMTARATLSHERRWWILISETTFQVSMGRSIKETTGWF